MADTEPLIQQIGGQIFSRVRQVTRRSVGQAIDQRLMSLGLRDQAIKTQLFRFVDVLPALHSSAQVSDHLRQYLQQAGPHLSAPMRLAVRVLPNSGPLGASVAALASSGAARLARRFIAGADLDQAATAVLELRKRSLAFTIDLLGEAVVSQIEADEYRDRYLQLLEGLSPRLAGLPEIPLIDRDDAGPLPRLNLSIKLSALDSRFDPIAPAVSSAAVRERLLPILRAARRLGAFVNFDMEQFAYKDLTLAIFQEIFGQGEFADWPDVGIVIQAYLKSSRDDLLHLIAWAGRRGVPIWVRLVKGAYWDYETVISAQQNWQIPVFTSKYETDANFESLSQLLLDAFPTVRAAIASHNIRAIAAAIAHAQSAGLSASQYEFQMLYGMAEPIKSALVEMGHRLRVYTPIGRPLPGMAYLVRRLLENTSNESFLRSGFLEHVPQEKLLMNPLNNIPAISSSVPHVPANASPEFANQPLSDFGYTDPRRQVAAAVTRAAEQCGRQYPLHIAGQSIETGRWLDAVNPSHRGQIVGRCAAATPELADQAVAAAKSAFAEWRNHPVAARGDLLRKTAGILVKNRFDLAAIEIHECGKPWREADADVAEAIDYCRFYALAAERLFATQRHDLPGETNRWLHEPRGVAVVIVPWNFPLAILCGMTTAALAAGNTVIMKPAEQSSIIAAKLMDAFIEAGFPPGVVNYLPGVGEEIGPKLVGHPDVSVIAFTGSRAVGLSIHQSAAALSPGQDHLKHVITEMGGKNAIIIDSDADLDDAITGVVASAFGYAGQKCSACSRLIILQDVYDAFLTRLIQATRGLRIAPAEDPACQLGPVIDATAHARILAAIEQAKGHATLACGGDLPDLSNEGFFIAPHIFTDASPDSFLAQEEIFGPVLTVMKAKNLSDALDLANSTRYALTGGLYSRSPSNIERCKREFRVGNLYINRKITGALVGRQPFGGLKLSGSGDPAGGPEYLPQFTILRCVTENTLRHGFAPTEA